MWQQFGAAALNTFNSNDPGQTVLNQHFPRASGDTLTLAVASTAPITSPAVKARITSALVPFERAAHVTLGRRPVHHPGVIIRAGRQAVLKASRRSIWNSVGAPSDVVTATALRTNRVWVACSSMLAARSARPVKMPGA